ncbi:hypothetical protein [Brumimicrobium aurantiacum]|uniref:PPM-type phosphatase domain-containing protein n=1 Tax=Brumimicrobium aurantiacum TaxID=1737063 RepID=A0A3E1EWW9_9FLAO|nr:hypothetical protein [Brumimicrobium aurantiacum]RFC54055.1 hypothetical protein DXU93_10980 [Brumimicrobium aurantiacum]
MYFSVKHIDIKLKQDYADFSIHEEWKSLILCDGIGEFTDSGKVAKLVVEQFIRKQYKSVSELIHDNELQKLKKEGVIGGTTFISARNVNNSDKVEVEYLGNGGIIHLHGDFSKNVNSEEPYRYGEIMIPHVSPNGALTRHISHNNGDDKFLFSKININLNYFEGDIIILFSDGISSLEDKVILKDNENRFWRNENPAIQTILNELNSFLISNNEADLFQDNLVEFNQTVLNKLKAEHYLEDDASLGFIITDSVLTHYQKNY